jgi:hypothetical protein
MIPKQVEDNRPSFESEDADIGDVADESMSSFVKHRDAYLDGEIRVDTVASCDRLSLGAQ